MQFTFIYFTNLFWSKSSWLDCIIYIQGKWGGFHPRSMTGDQLKGQLAKGFYFDFFFFGGGGGICFIITSTIANNKRLTLQRKTILKIQRRMPSTPKWTHFAKLSKPMNQLGRISLCMIHFDFFSTLSLIATVKILIRY